MFEFKNLIHPVQIVAHHASQYYKAAFGDGIHLILKLYEYSCMAIIIWTPQMRFHLTTPYILMRFRLSSTVKRPKNADDNEDFRKIVESFENAPV